MLIIGRVLSPPIITCDENGQQTKVQTEKGRWTFENQVVKIVNIIINALTLTQTLK
jgi:hypothetical protein